MEKIEAERRESNDSLDKKIRRSQQLFDAYSKGEINGDGIETKFWKTFDMIPLEIIKWRKIKSFDTG